MGGITLPKLQPLLPGRQRQIYAPAARAPRLHTAAASTSIIATAPAARRQVANVAELAAGLPTLTSRRRRAAAVISADGQPAGRYTALMGLDSEPPKEMEEAA